MFSSGGKSFTKNHDILYKPCEERDIENEAAEKTVCTRYLTVIFFLLFTAFSCSAVFYQFLRNVPSENVINSLEYADYRIASRKGAACRNIKDEKKFDCFPSGTANETSCLARGCCWSQNIDGVDGVPSCYYPSDFQSYKVVKVKKTLNGAIVILELLKKSVYPNDVKTVSMKITFETESRLRIKITDHEKERYEPPLPKVPDVDIVVNKSIFTVKVLKNTFGFAVVRKDSGTIIFDARNVGGFVFSDQFLQMSALIPTHNVFGFGRFQQSTNWNEILLFNGKTRSSMGHTDSYGSHPFYLALEEDGKSHGVFLLNSNAIHIVLQPAPAITYRAIGGVLDFYFFLGPSPKDVVRQYTEVIGFTFMPPYWSFGFHLCRWGLHNLSETEQMWQRNRDIQLPFDTQWNDIDYMEGWNDFTVGKNFTGLGDFVRKLHEVEMKYIVITDPGVGSKLPAGTYPPYDDGLKQQIFILNSSNLPIESEVWNFPSGTVFPDFTNPRVTSYWLKMISTLHENIAFDGLWLDMNEISAFYQGSKQGCEKNPLDNPPYLPENVELNHGTLCMNAKLNASSFYNVHNIYALAECSQTYYALAEVRKQRPFILSRSTFAGSGRVAAHWTGDIYSNWGEMKDSVADIMAFNLFGIPMTGADICGFAGNTEEQLCTRWHQLGAFYPFSRNHNSQENVAQDPAARGQKLIASTKNALRLRYKLLPYLYTLFWHAHRDGNSVIRPLFFEFDDDANTYSIDDQFLWGPALLILPVLTKDAVTVTSYLPKGTWFDIYTFSSIQSEGKRFTIDAPLDKIPVFIRGGYIIPYQEPSRTTTESRKNPFGLYVALNEDGIADGFFFWDDGDSFISDDSRSFNELHFKCDGTELTSKIIYWGYHANMELDTVYILGVTKNVNEVYINNEKHQKFVLHNQVLFIQSTNLDLSKTFKITWH